MPEQRPQDCDPLDEKAHDPGDAVPPGVAPADPPPEPRPQDLEVKRKLEEMAREQERR
ncbi:MAG TPA: hypothetical protein VE684_03280 [Crenalkalicoccus sp.]|nr:hypothetical protein [Crenalkalicoccus sp.]